MLRADRDAVLEVRNGVVRIDPEGLSADELDQAVRNQAGESNMGHEASAAYHLRKHYHELPESETTGDRVRDYHDSMELTIRNGTLVDWIPFPGVGEKFVYQREVPDPTGRVDTMKAIVLVRSDGMLVTMTYGRRPG
ncbi:hypothetical protein EV190_103206 [Actinorugispora endophytica]|uniref:Bacterial CdiA-CT RNAse A domain-containing protein n=2 Tax=Actinorugispora endophytica TaxID=1605990 RepID=A0A4R6V143_9ACTN|nr:hypothetical protein EV190_103206 [Actinorugispora endophytica]